MILSTANLGDWADLPFFTDDLPAIAAQLDADPRDILPPENRIFAAFQHTSLAKVRVVILGQDPYPTPGHAHGLAFSAEPHVTPLPRSLANIYKEMIDDIGQAPMTADVRFWADQGVLLLNTVLTVPAGEANGHKHLGWQRLSHQVLNATSAKPCAYVLWGKQAQSLAPHISSPNDGTNPENGHLMIETAHPSPLSARRGFFGSKPFSRINSWLAARGEPSINWTDA
ncbi:uracil-DNA glycosylase [Shimia haliotis]|uniref:Uracil-DNA glycosylase n=1 Tax=Shimia haliotis TaxID=1280847 RepID=A0A1I4AP80_9RHOB|nr:uracil-DNA glycosylase [Shimia haliotis]SFK58322.1 Uracil-DNA glycosylase [Shimia haliotis]